MAVDFEAEGLLDGLDDEARQARLELLTELADDGVPLEELRAATHEERLPLLRVERVLEGDGERLTATEVAERSGLDADFLVRLWRALGMVGADVDEPVYTAADLEAAERVAGFRAAGFSDDQLIEITRVMSRGMANVAAAIGETFRKTFIQSSDSEHELSVRYAETSQALLPMLAPTLEHVLNVQQRSLIRQAAVNLADLDDGGGEDAPEIAVAFADLVGFTKLGEAIEPQELGAIAGRLDALAAEVAPPPVRVVKAIGDAVMLASPDVDALLDTILALVDAADTEAEGFPQLRAGVAYGRAVGRSGDWFGRPVNRASRITGVARPSSVLSDDAVKEAATGDWRWSFAGERGLKGVPGKTKLHRVRRPDDGQDRE